MSAPAPLPDVADQSEKEAGGLSILDLTKHAARTILETMKDGDRLGIVTFSTDATVRSSPFLLGLLSPTDFFSLDRPRIDPDDG